ncbi:hypothetical protein FMEAI12_2820005 [Parafrankia sp. Ea1.12]|nr:hypothetical protein FMEAI12_2820005 [Parafrankia sp. Ea1.12]
MVLPPARHRRGMLPVVSCGLPGARATSVRCPDRVGKALVNWVFVAIERDRGGGSKMGERNGRRLCLRPLGYGD